MIYGSVWVHIGPYVPIWVARGGYVAGLHHIDDDAYPGAVTRDCARTNRTNKEGRGIQHTRTQIIINQIKIHTTSINTVSNGGRRGPGP